MNKPKIFLLGGYGNTGRALAQLLVEETDRQIVIAGRNREKAERAARELNQAVGAERVSGAAADASDPASLVAALAGCEMILVASSTAKYARQVALAALEAGVDYLDIQYSTQKINELKSLSGQIESAGRCFITDGGFHPGLPAALVRWAAPAFDRLESAIVGSVMKQDWAGFNLPDETATELIDELNDFVPLVFKDRRWQKISAWQSMKPQEFDFGEPFGRQACYPMFLEEMYQLPELYPNLQETGFFVGGFNPFVDWIVMPLAMVGLKAWPGGARKPLGRLMKWGLEHFSRPPFGMVLKLTATGTKNDQPKQLDLVLSQPDGYVFTAIPVAACLLQLLDGSIRQPGLWTQANLVEPGRFLLDMERMGIEVECSGSTGRRVT